MNQNDQTESAAAVDIEQPPSLVAYLRARGELGAGEIPAIHVLAGGVSNKTVEVIFADGRHWVLKQALPQLRVKSEWFSDPARIHREAAGMRALGKLLPAGNVTRFIFEDFETHVMAMSAVPLPHENLKTLLLAGQIDLDLIHQLAEILATIHRDSSARSAELSAEFADQTYFESLRLEPYYLTAASNVPEAAGFLNELVEATRRRRLALVHGDYSPKNILVSKGTLILLDHEVIHWGDPAFDIGFCMTHLLSKAHHLAAKRNEFLNAANVFQQAYFEKLGRLLWAGDLESFGVRHTLACLLARVAGRSPLEYLSPAEQDRQREVVLGLMKNPPARLRDLVEQFGRAI